MQEINANDTCLKCKTVRSYFGCRIRERSTWLGMIAVATACGVHISPELTEELLKVGMIIGGAISIVTKDKK